MTRGFVLGVLAAVVVLTLTAAAQTRSGDAPDSLAVRELQAKMGLLESRVERLEGYAAMRSPSMVDESDHRDASPATGGPTPSRYMRLDGIDTTMPERADDDIERLQREVEALERTVQSSERKVASYSSNRRGGSYRAGYSSSSSNIGGARAEGQMLAKYKSELRRKEGELKRLQREANEPRQVIVGNRDGVIITLHTTRDLSRGLDRIETGDYLTWSGRRIASDSVSEEWAVSSIQKVAAPEGS